MKLTKAESAQIIKQRKKAADHNLKIIHARDVLANVSDADALQIASQLTARDTYITARDACGCYRRTDELCKVCRKLFDKWFFGRSV